jgi:NADH-quinone oxidoreductase subunit H
MGFWEDPILFLAEWLRGVFIGWGISAQWADVINQLIGAVVVGMGTMIVFIVLTWVERKGAARFQDRMGPNRVGPWGIFQPFADAIKMLTKEDTTPAGADKFTYNLAPVMSTFAVLLAWGVMPFTPNWVGADLDVGVLYIAAVGSFGVLAVMLAGWSSNNKYSLIGAFRGVAQLIAYEVPLFLSLLVPVFLARTIGINSIVEAQINDGIWYFFMVPMVWVIYYISSLAEVGRAPFDLLEAESELVAGYQVEYSGMKFGLFQVGEFLHSWTFAALNASIFFGGYSFFGLEKYWWAAFIIFIAKTFFFYMVVIWTRMTFPRVRIDQMMNLNWKFMVPVSLSLLMGIPLIEYFVRVNSLGTFPRWALLFAFNVIVGVIFFTVATRTAKKEEKERVRFEPRPVAVMPKVETPEEEAAA